MHAWSVDDDDLDLEALQRLIGCGSQTTGGTQKVERDSNPTTPGVFLTAYRQQTRLSTATRAQQCLFNSNVFRHLQQWVTVHLVNLKHSFQCWMFGRMGLGLLRLNLRPSD